MRYAIHINTLSSVFQDSSEKSKQTSQLLFGELCAIKSEREDYFYIENVCDKHCGWVLKNAFVFLDEQDANKIRQQELLRTCMPLIDIFNLRDKTVLRLPAGSIISNYNPELSKFTIGDLEFQIHSSFISYLPHGNIDGIVETALAFVNTPFMYGGKSVLGIDKGGFVQLIFNLCGYSMPRTIQEQIKVGVPVYSVEQLRKGDLLFVEDRSNGAVDVFIYLQNNSLVGVEEKVKIVNLENINTEITKYTIRRLV